MSKKFFELVHQFFNLLDADGNGSIDVFEARSSLTICFASLLNTDKSGPKIDEVVQSQVSWLFKEADENKDQQISREEFVNCYKKLLKENPLPSKKGSGSFSGSLSGSFSGSSHAGIEEEVLRIDLERAIQALTRSRRASLVATEQIYFKVKYLFKTLDTDKDGVITVADVKDSLSRCFASVIKSHSEAQQLLQQSVQNSHHHHHFRSSSASSMHAIASNSSSSSSSSSSSFSATTSFPTASTSSSSPSTPVVTPSIRTVDSLSAILSLAVSKDSKDSLDKCSNECKTREKLTEEEFISIFKQLVSAQSQITAGIQLPTLESDVDVAITHLTKTKKV